MAIKVELEKDGYVKSAFVGFSWTSLFFNIFVPAFRLDWKRFKIYGGLFILNTGLKSFFKIYFLRMENYEMVDMMDSIFSSISLIGVIILAFWNNKSYTTDLLKDGWLPLDEDELSNAILKNKGYLAYTDEDNDEKKLRYIEIFKQERKKETRKLLIFFGILALIILLLIAFVVIIAMRGIFN